ncbi:hypothetical protein [Bowdeniella massiliensis]|uniref:hypothetical protein n=1 Tax=Bowdeniella massiliensis TaxID=2932264 RepID=UPI002028368E|nr:hypothetical protein [Bowdeniella massiliensis]
MRHDAVLFRALQREKDDVLGVAKSNPERREASRTSAPAARKDVATAAPTLPRAPVTIREPR